MTRISDMTPVQVTSPTGMFAPVEKTGSTTNYRVDLAATMSVTPQMFPGGANGDNSAIVSALAYLSTSPFTGHGYGTGTGPLYIPASTALYQMGATPIDLTFTMRISGDGAGYGGGWSTALKWGAGSHGYRIQYYNTSGDTATGSGVAGGSSSVIENQALQGGYTTTDGGFHGIFARASLSARDLNIFDFQGDGIHIHADSGQPESGNANGWEVSKVFIQNTLNGLWVDGHDSNQGVASQVLVSGARQWGIYDNAGAQNLYIAPLTQLCGWSNNDGTAGKPVSTVSQGGQRYAVIAGQEVGASTNAPNGLSGIGTGDNTWWCWYSAGGADAFNVAWFSGIAVRAGGPLRMTGATLLHPYAEAGQPPCQFGGDVLRIGGTLGNRVIGGAHITANSNQVGINDLSITTGNLLLGDDGSGSLTIGRYSAGNPYSFIIPSPLSTSLIIRAPDNNAAIEVSSTSVQIDKDLNLNTGKVLKVAGTQVIGARQTGWTADTGTAKKTANATYTAGTTLTYSAAYVQAEQTAMATRVAALEVVIQANSQTIKALKDTLIAHGLAGA